MKPTGVKMKSAGH